ncbi:MAG: hypothetical protein JNM79_19035 [Burkholderiales bacterium]|nr:hypothetical protein [Burkholderiales bacterium]
MTETSQRRAIRKYRERLGERGMARYEVLGLDRDRDLIRTVARRLAESGPAAAHLRAAVVNATAGGSATTGGILAALRRSPMVGADLKIVRARDTGRKVDL